jgi:hypothetical protein
VDREQARRTLLAGFWMGLGAAGLFAFTFVIAILYIA